MSIHSNVDLRIRRGQILRALSVSPLTAEQITTLSVTFVERIKKPEYTKKIMGRIRDEGDVLEFKYPDGIKYWRLSKDGVTKVYGEEKTKRKRSQFQPLSKSLWYHAKRLGDVLVRLQVSAYEQGIEVLEVFGDRQLTLNVEDEIEQTTEAKQEAVTSSEDSDNSKSVAEEEELKSGRRKQPDGKIGFKVKINGKKSYHYFYIELDCGTEWGYDSDAEDSLNNLIQFYLDHYNSEKDKVKVLMLFDQPSRRVHHFLNRVEELNRQPNQRIIKAATVDQLLQHENPLQSPYFLDYDKQLCSLLPSRQTPHQQVPLPKLDMASVAC